MEAVTENKNVAPSAPEQKQQYRFVAEGYAQYQKLEKMGSGASLPLRSICRISAAKVPLAATTSAEINRLDSSLCCGKSGMQVFRSFETPSNTVGLNPTMKACLQPSCAKSFW